MPYKLKRPCKHFMCPATTDDPSGYCPDHIADNAMQLKQRQASRIKQDYAAWYNTAAWHNYRNQYLQAHPLCVECLKENRYTQATDVDHIRPFRGDRLLFWDASNHQSLCHACHSRKTAREDGGFGNTKK